MAPLPPLVDAAWKSYVTGLKRTPRYQEFIAAESNITIQDQAVKFRKLVLDPKSATYAKLLSDTKVTDKTATQPAPDSVTLKYTVETRGPPPDDGSGYPLFLAMHGGGQSSTDNNNTQWAYMTKFYKGAISQGLYVALRGMGDTWDLHFTQAGYVLIERLIENFILFGNVNPNKVYILGFSAGGDGVFRIAPRLAQRFAAANVGGGHPGSVNFENMTNLPICLQVGEYDNYLGRCKSLVGSGIAIDNLRSRYPNEPFVYQKDVYIQQDLNNLTFNLDAPLEQYSERHWNWEAYNANLTPENYPTRGWLKVVNDYKYWYDNYPKTIPDQNFRFADTNAINWMTSHQVNRARPRRVVWDLRDGDNFGSAGFSDLSGRGVEGIGRSQNYWLDIGRYTRETVGDIIEASIDKDTNTVNIVRAQNYLRILLTPDMLAQPYRPVTVKIANQSLSIQVKWDNLIVVAETLVRNDPTFVFTGDIVLTQRKDGDRSWVAQTAVVTPRL